MAAARHAPALTGLRRAVPAFLRDSSRLLRRYGMWTALAVLLLLPSSTQAQSFGDMLGHIEAGIGYERMEFETRQHNPYRIRPWDFEMVHYGALCLSWNFFLPVHRDASFGISPGFRIALTRAKEPAGNDPSVPQPYDPDAKPSGGDGIVMFPLLLTFRYGPDATAATTKPVGFGLGMGVRAQQADRRHDGYRYVSPTVLAELTFRIKYIMKLQFMTDFTPEVVEGHYLDARLMHWGVYLTFVKPFAYEDDEDEE